MRWLKKFRDAGRKRRARRFQYAAELRAKCKSWERFSNLFAADISKSGMYIKTKENAKVGEVVTIELTLPEGGTLNLEGVVVRTIDAELSRRLGKPRGLGVRFKQPEGEAAEQLQNLLRRAAEAQTSPQLPSESAGAFAEDAPPAKTADSLVVNDEPSQNKGYGGGPPPTPEQGDIPRMTPKTPQRNDLIVGIDMGTSYTSVSSVKGGRVNVWPRETGEASSASVIWFKQGVHPPITGPEARRKLPVRPREIVNSPKRILGRGYSEQDVQQFFGRAAYQHKAGPNDTPLVFMHGSPYAIPQICGFLLDDILEVAARHLGQRPDRAVISIPVSFGDDRIAALRKAAQLARLDLVDVIDEPSAAALANRHEASGGVVGVYDFGGGTFDFSVVDATGGDYRVLATAGDTWLGGDDFDRALAEAVANQFWRANEIELRNDAVAWQRLVHATEITKRALSAKEQAVLYVPEIRATANGKLDVNVSVSRRDLAAVSQTLIKRSLETCEGCLDLLDMKPSDLSAVFLSGGTTYMPVIRSALVQYFGVPVRSAVPPEHAVCLGASIHAHELMQTA